MNKRTRSEDLNLKKPRTRPREPFLKRIAAFEKRAIVLDQERKEKEAQIDIN